MKGQFFIIGALLMVLMFYVGISPMLSPSYTGPEIRKDIENMFDNIEREYPKVFNSGMISGKAEQYLVNFSGFISEESEKKSVQFSVLWLTVKNITEDINITVGNFLGYNTTITLNVSGDISQISIENGKTNSDVFASPPSEFQLIINFNTTQNNLLLEKYKASFYSVMELRKGTDKIAGEIIS